MFNQCATINKNVTPIIDKCGIIIYLSTSIILSG